ncbi:MAG TPA: haloacid dehalogenase type II [Terriglobales bacterium]|jgi:2-haloacid dehalogenase|nr:haloacid dehalogenase type II [Terriglobales bacterium]
MLAFDSFQAITFDCYGTLIDWESGILRVFQPLLAEHGKRVPDEQILALYGELEPAIQSGEYLPYRVVLEEVVRGMGQHFGFSVSTDEARGLAASLKNWMPYPDTVAALRALKGRYRLGIISNTDDDLFSDTARHLRVAFDWVITAEQARAYKPARAIFELALRKIGLAPEKVLHAGQSIFHDVIPARQMGMATLLVTRRGPGATKRVAAQADLEVPDLKTLAEMAVSSGGERAAAIV